MVKNQLDKLPNEILYKIAKYLGPVKKRNFLQAARIPVRQAFRRKTMPKKVYMSHMKAGRLNTSGKKWKKRPNTAFYGARWH